MFPILELAVTFVTSQSCLQELGEPQTQPIVHSWDANWTQRHGQLIGNDTVLTAIIPPHSTSAIDSRDRPLLGIDRQYLVTNNNMVSLMPESFYFQLDVSRKRFRILRVSRFRRSAALNCAGCLDHWRGR